MSFLVIVDGHFAAR